MSDVAGAAEWIKWGLGGVASAGLFFAGALGAALNRVRGEDAKGRAALWVAVNKLADERGADRVEVRDMIAGLRQHFDDRLREHEATMRDLITNRPPVRRGAA